MTRKQIDFFLLVAAFVVLFAVVLAVLNARQNQMSQVAPTASISPTFPVPGTSIVSPTPPVSPTLLVSPNQEVSETPPPLQQTPSAPTPGATEIPSSPTPQALGKFYVSPDGIAENDGSIDQPWSLQHVLNGNAAIEPGDTVWVQGGSYVGPFVSNLRGARNQPVILRAVPGARAVLTGDDLILDIQNSAYVYYWGLEIAPLQNDRDPKTRKETSYGIRIHQGKRSHDLKFINLIIHDMPAQGFAWWRANIDSELYGSLIYFNGVTQLDHGLYVQNEEGTKSILDNIIFDNASHGIHAYGEKDYQKLDNLHLDGNTLFDNGSIGYNEKKGTWGGSKRNILIGGYLVAEHPVVVNNYTYFPSLSGESLNLGYRAGTLGAVVENNYFAGGVVQLGGINQDIQMLKNTILGFTLPELSLSQNEFLVIKPADPKIFIRPNQYEPGRANITIYNWDKRPVVRLSSKDLQGVGITKGDRYELRNVQDYFSDILTGTYDGIAIEIPMTDHTVAQPMGLSFKPESTFPQFGTFVLMTNSAASIP